MYSIYQVIAWPDVCSCVGSYDPLLPANSSIDLLSILKKRKTRYDQYAHMKVHFIDQQPSDLFQSKAWGRTG